MKLLTFLALTATLLGSAAFVEPGVLSRPLASPGARATTPLPLTVTPAQEFPEIPYDGRFTFIRVRFESGGSGLRGFGRRGGRGPVWAHDYPRAETNFLKILDETTMIRPFLGGSRILAMDDPEIFKYPLIYIVEVGFWEASDREVETLGAYLSKGGFLIVDDFRDVQIYNIRDILQRALPGLRLMEVPDDHEIFDAFFRIEEPRSLESYGWEPPTYLGIFQDNDPTGRLMAILNYNGDIAEYWEFSDYGYLPIDLTNEAYKFGVNYVVYAMTH